MRHVTAVAALVVAVAFAAVAGWAWWSAAHDPQVRRAEQRREVLAQARESIATLTTMDGRDVDAGVHAWRAASTGPLHDELTDPATADRLRDQAGTTGRVVDLAVTELGERTATVIAAVDTEVARDGAKPETTGSRLEAELTRTSQGWRISALAPVGLGAA
ncbi:hypothetical protein OOZ19_05075 [Saccharopolyspora sp. NFXS83]|uniref:hypothetical protein n=1 Tax=Saccharopolyspora sp. NFXS83 TaxID=2993560 RepID=UPI00224B7B47|nr:hypothetical protein [Saccharopolyspora sp. NFXS83]MCX2729601.1 hypothetical protein [Saccharopolyspora sp. NFXS83]